MFSVPFHHSPVQSQHFCPFPWLWGHRRSPGAGRRPRPPVGGTRGARGAPSPPRPRSAAGFASAGRAGPLPVLPRRCPAPKHRRCPVSQRPRPAGAVPGAPGWWMGGAAAARLRRWCGTVTAENETENTPEPQGSRCPERQLQTRSLLGHRERAGKGPQWSRCSGSACPQLAGTSLLRAVRTAPLGRR